MVGMIGGAQSVAVWMEASGLSLRVRSWVVEMVIDSVLSCSVTGWFSAACELQVLLTLESTTLSVHLEEGIWWSRNHDY